MISHDSQDFHVNLVNPEILSKVGQDYMISMIYM